MRILLTFILLHSYIINAKDTIKDKNKHLNDYSCSSIFFETSGNTASLLSINYEYNFINNHFNDSQILSINSFRIGYGTGYWRGSDGLLLMLNWQVGSWHRMELGFGSYTGIGKFEDLWTMTVFEDTKYRTLLTFTLGYKYVNLEDDWLFKLGLTPLISLEGEFAFLLGVSYGWTF